MLMAQPNRHFAKRLRSQHAGQLPDCEGGARGARLVKQHGDVLTLHQVELHHHHMVHRVQHQAGDHHQAHREADAQH
jgi:hypothetical protein